MTDRTGQNGTGRSNADGTQQAAWEAKLADGRRRLLAETVADQLGVTVVDQESRDDDE